MEYKHVNKKKQKSLQLENKLKEVIGDGKARRLAYDVGFQKRNGGKISPFNFFYAFCKKSVQGGCSIEQYTVTLSTIMKKCVSKQAVWKRITPLAGAFFLAILQMLIGENLNASICIVKELLDFFPRILIQDSTVIALHKSLFKYYPGSANQNGNVSSLKIQAVYNLINSSFVYFKLTSFRVNEQAAAKDLSFLKKGDLLIRDLGYFSVEVFKSIMNKKAFFLSRLKYGVNIYCAETGDKINLLKLLKGNKLIDINILLGSKIKLPVRLIAQKLPKKKSDKRKREYNSNRDKRLNASKERLEVLCWNIYITNISASQWSATTIIALYALRWRIEIIFKSWKSNLNFKVDHKMNANQVDLLIYSRLVIITVLTNYHFPKYYAEVHSKSGRHLSLLKFINHVVSNFDVMTGYFESRNTKEKKLLMDILIKNATYDKRKRLNFMDNLYALSEDLIDFNS